MISNRNFSILLLIPASVGISFGGLIMRNINYADAWQIIFYKALSFIFLITLILFNKYKFSIVSKIKIIGFSGMIGSFLLMLANLLIIQAYANTSIANTSFTLSAIPFITAGLAYIFLKEKLSLRTLLIMIVAFFGIFIMINEGLGKADFHGNLMALGCAFCFSGFAIIVRKFRNIDMLPTLLISGVMIVIVSFVLNFQNLTISIHDVLLCFLWGGILSVFVNISFIYSTRFLYASEVTFFMLLEISLSPFWVWIFLNETISQVTFYGGIIVMASVAVYSYFEIRNSKMKPISTD